MYAHSYSEDDFQQVFWPSKSPLFIQKSKLVNILVPWKFTAAHTDFVGNSVGVGWLVFHENFSTATCLLCHSSSLRKSWKGYEGKFPWNKVVFTLTYLKSIGCHIGKETSLTLCSIGNIASKQLNSQSASLVRQQVPDRGELCSFKSGLYLVCRAGA